MSGSLGLGAASRDGRVPYTAPCTGSGQRGRKLVAALQIELAVGAAQMHLDGLRGEVEAARDLAVGGAGGRELGPPPLGGRQGPGTGAGSGPRPAAREQQLGPSALAQRVGAAGVGGVVRIAQDRASRASLAGGA